MIFIGDEVFDFWCFQELTFCKCVTEACICSMSVTLDVVTVSFRKSLTVNHVVPLAMFNQEEKIV